jgi:hypothetical protein
MRRQRDIVTPWRLHIGTFRKLVLIIHSKRLDVMLLDILGIQYQFICQYQFIPSFFLLNTIRNLHLAAWDVKCWVQEELSEKKLLLY